MELLSKTVPVAVLVLVVSSMLAMGLGLTLREILAPLRNGRLVVLALLANCVLMPLGALAIAKLLRLDQPLGLGLLLLGAAAGSPFLPKLAAMAQGDLASAVALMVLLTVVTIVYMPLVLPLLVEGVSVDSLKIARSLVLLMLLPLAVALAIKARIGVGAARALPWLERVSTLSLVLLVVLLLVTNIKNVIDLFGTRGIGASILFLLVGSGVGWLLGGPSARTKDVLALGTAQRNISAALAVGSQNFDDPRVMVMLVVVAIFGLILLIPLARGLAKVTPEG
jgi:BASS family bile acid:Na+ symporter